MTTKSDSAMDAVAPSPEALLKAAVSGAKAPETAKPPAPIATGRGRRIDPLTLALTAAGLALGALLGAGSALLAVPRDGTGLALADVHAGLEANRREAARLGIASERLDTSVAALKDAVDAARSEAKARSTGLTDTVHKVETALAGKIGALAERIDQAEKEQTARITTLSAQAEKRPVAAAVPAPAAKAEPIQTGSLPKTKTKPGIVETWAVRDVYDGTAMLEDRRRRLIEVVTGDTIPGVGRVEGVERRGRDWVVVTRQGLVTPQAW